MRKKKTVLFYFIILVFFLFLKFKLKISKRVFAKMRKSKKFLVIFNLILMVINNILMFFKFSKCLLLNSEFKYCNLNNSG